MKVAAVLLTLFALVGAAFWLFGASASTPALIAGLPDDGMRGAPCPARTIAEEKAWLKHGVPPPAALARKLRQNFPLGSDAGALEALLTAQGFELFPPCPNDESVFGARWLSRRWGEPDAYVFWRADDAGKLTFLDGQVSRTP
ncbi:hypothetical protein [Rhodoblastus sp.]|uniref:hypothetical protein n=1 Tax=Rhodoblastus sp. TaxID=1962975 RepID=UPI00260B7CD4|nr:hypothetical protein [Rhodoblastus sp.]